jgi:hypothetical protein
MGNQNVTSRSALDSRTTGQEKSGSTEPLTKRQGREGRISGKAMQGEPTANAETLIMEKLKSLE